MFEDNNNNAGLTPTNWGFHPFPEKLNGRIAMIAIILIFLIEGFTKKGVLQLITSIF